MFWNVYYVKGAFLDADKAFEVLSGIRTAELRLVAKCINTIVLARCLELHPLVNVHCSALPDDPNAPLAARLMRLGLPAPLFTIDFEGRDGRPAVPPEVLKRLFDSLEPAFGLQVTLGQVNTVVLCPALTSHSELSDEALAAARITRSTLRIAVGDEDPRTLLSHMAHAAALAGRDAVPGLAAGFPDAGTAARIYEEVYLDVHRRWIADKCVVSSRPNGATDPVSGTFPLP
jgi:cystathionine beta-lyase/cystathionine gamma-synthase